MGTRVPLLGPFITRVIKERDRKRKFPGQTTSADFWEQIYDAGGTSGSGSTGRLAAFKAEVINNFVAQHEISSVVEFGCGDSSQLALMRYPQYLGVDVSQTAVTICRNAFHDDTTKAFQLVLPTGAVDLPKADLAISLDVVYHLIEDEIFSCYMERLFAHALRFVIIYSSNTEDDVAWPEVRHRVFTDWTAENVPDWDLMDRIPNRYPRTRVAPRGDNSWSDFYIFRKSVAGSKSSAG
jgi:hypothetical protein